MEPKSENIPKILEQVRQKQQAIPEPEEPIALVTLEQDSEGNLSLNLNQEHSGIIIENKYAVIGLFEEFKHNLLNVPETTED